MKADQFKPEIEGIMIVKESVELQSELLQYQVDSHCNKSKLIHKITYVGSMFEKLKIIIESEDNEVMSGCEIVYDRGIECYSPSDIMKILNYSKASTYRLFRSKDFPSFRVNVRSMRVTRKDFKVWLEDRRTKEISNI